MVYNDRHCFVPGCTSGYPKTKQDNAKLGLKNMNLFRAKNQLQVEEWRRVIPRSDKEFQRNNAVCEAHFADHCIVRFDETMLKDGTIHRLPRDRPKLLENSIPSIFPNLPKYLSKAVKRPRKFTKTVGMKDVRGMPSSIGESTEERCAHLNGGVHPGSDLLLLAEIASAYSPIVGPPEVEACTVFDIIQNINSVPLPSRCWATAVVGNNAIFARFGINFQLERTVVITEVLRVKVMFAGHEVAVNGVESIKVFEDVTAVITLVDGLNACEGVPGMERSSTHCLGFVPHSFIPVRAGKFIRCPPCRAAHKRAYDRERKKLPFKQKMDPARKALKLCRIRNARLSKKVQEVKSMMLALQKEFSEISGSVLDKEISGLPEAQKEALQACFAASKAKGPKGRRYTLSWVYECLLLRIQSRQSYVHLRNRKILPLPGLNTLSRYIRSLKGTYGFQEAIFECMKEKAKGLAPEDRRGTLLLDEMKLSMRLSYDKHTFKVNGFTDLGDHTPLHQKHERGDHALVLMFQPFRGRWVQALACFLSKGCASSTVLHHLILECIIMLEKANFYVDVVTCDGAQWNRSMWKKFGIDQGCVSCEHPFRSSGRLWFSSDFPHLIKNMRNFIVSRIETMTPDGVVKLGHWDAVLQVDQPRGYNLKACPKLTYDHVHPRPFQKMNVARAFQFFGRNVAAAMETYKEHHPDLADCSPSVAIIERVKGLIHAMNSRTPAGALKTDSEQWRVIEEFIDFFYSWERVAELNGYHFLSTNTRLGFKVTLKTTLELCRFLEEECGYSYLMTARLNQDALERYFSMMRAACGSNDHPDSLLFMQIFKLMGAYSLVKPPRGSNISGDEMLDTLLKLPDISSPQIKAKEEYKSLIRGICQGRSQGPNMEPEMPGDHNYGIQRTPDFIVTYFAGYVARKASKLTKCNQCQESVISQSPGVLARERFTTFQNEGHLVYASECIFQLVRELEYVTGTVLNAQDLSVDTVFQIGHEVERRNKVPLVGCRDHCHRFTEAIVNMFLTVRMHLACQRANKNDSDAQEATRLNRKKSKL